MKPETSLKKTTFRRATADGYIQIEIGTDASYVKSTNKGTAAKRDSKVESAIAAVLPATEFYPFEPTKNKKAGICITALVTLGRVFDHDDKTDSSYTTLESNITIFSAQSALTVEDALVQYKAQIARSEPIIVHALGALTTDEAEVDLLFSTIMQAVTPKEVN
jgi:hypothetical protein